MAATRNGRVATAKASKADRLETLAAQLIRAEAREAELYEDLYHGPTGELLSDATASEPIQAGVSVPTDLLNDRARRTHSRAAWRVEFLQRRLNMEIRRRGGLAAYACGRIFVDQGRERDEGPACVGGRTVMIPTDRIIGWPGGGA